MTQERETSRGLFRAGIRWMLFIAGILLILLLILHILGQQIQVQGSSMYPTLEDGDSLILDRVSYLLRQPARNDIVVFPSRYQDNVRYIKRIVALPGETVQIINGSIYINGQPDGELTAIGPIEQPGLAARQITLGEDEYFVLGDNRNDSSDSREPAIGNIRRQEFQGRILLRIWPVTKFTLF